MKKTTTILFLLLPLFAIARYSRQPYVALTYSDFVHPVSDTSVKDVYHNPITNKIVVKASTGKIRYKADSVWGFVDKYADAYRLYKGDAYELKQADTLSIYKRHSGKHSHYYFSNGLDGNIEDLSMHYLKKTFGQANPKFVYDLKHQLKWYQSFNSQEKASGSYRIIDIYKSSIKTTGS